MVGFIAVRFHFDAQSLYKCPAITAESKTPMVVKHTDVTQTFFNYRKLFLFPTMMAFIFLFFSEFTCTLFPTETVNFYLAVSPLDRYVANIVNFSSRLLDVSVASA